MIASQRLRRLPRRAWAAWPRTWLAALAVLLGSAPGLGAQTLEDYDYEELRIRGIGLEGGWVIPINLAPAALGGIRADLGYVGPGVRISPGIRYWSSRLAEPELVRLSEQILALCRRQEGSQCPDTLDLGEVRRSDLELGIDAHYVFGPPDTRSLYTGAGLSLHLLNGRGEFIDDTFVEDLLDTAAPGLNLLLGALLPVGRLELFGEARLVVTPDVQYANLLLGTVWSLPTTPVAPRRLP